MITSFIPVAVQNMSPIFAASSICITRYPSMTAFRAAIGSTSVTITLAPIPRARLANPLPQCPYPATTKVLPASKTLVARIIPSSVDWPVPCTLSKSHLVDASLTAITG